MPRSWLRRSSALVAARFLAACFLLWAGAAPARTVLVVGDSLGAGYGLRADEGWVSLLAERLRTSHPEWQVVNASISGDTTAGGRARLPAALARHRPDIVVIELGGNDGLRGIAPGVTRENLDAMIRDAGASRARVLLLGMRIPPNYGPAYTEAFHAVYHDLAEAHEVGLLPFFLEGVGGEDRLMQGDGIHPTAEAQPRLLDNVWPHLLPLL